MIPAALVYDEIREIIVQEHINQWDQCNYLQPNNGNNNNINAKGTETTNEDIE